VASDVAFGIRSSSLVCQDLSRDACAGVGYRPASLRWQELPRFLPDPEMRRRQPIQHAIADFALDFEREESVCGHAQRA
jgi:hypothetical protein